MEAAEQATWGVQARHGDDDRVHVASLVEYELLVRNPACCGPSAHIEASTAPVTRGTFQVGCGAGRCVRDQGADRLVETTNNKTRRSERD